jgi:eukaryotic-like serine/threonine-protein kinase
MARADNDRNLLFGLLALQAGLIERQALSDALRIWVEDRSRKLADILVEQGALTERLQVALELLIGEHIRTHDNDPTKSLASVDASQSTLDALTLIGDPEIDATVEYIGSDTTRSARTESTTDYDVGSAGQGSRRFRVIRPHKRGGLGAVYVALDSELNREVALKQILERHADDPASRARFLLEAEITGGLEHPGIVPVYSLGTFRDGRPYYAMRFIKGDSLKDAIRAFHRKDGDEEPPAVGSRELELRKLLRRFLDVCNAIEYAHQRGVLHRDLKPGNVMVGKYGETLVVDWGLAKAVGKPDPDSHEGEVPIAPSHSSGTVETLPGAAIGTPSYMSPEQAAGELDRLGARSDVYSLGATLYCLLTGRPPYEGPDAGAVIYKVRKGDLVSPTKHDPSIDRALEAICLKAMAHKAEDRYASPAILAEEVDRWMADEPVLAFPEPRARKLRRWARRHSSLVTGGGVFLILAVLGLGLVAWLVSRQNARLEVARLEARTAGEMAHKAVRTLLSDVVRNELLNIPQGEMVRVKLAERALELYRDFVKLHPANAEFSLEHARIEEQVASLYRVIGQYDKAKVEYDHAIARLNALLKPESKSSDVLEYLAYTEDQLAEMIRLRGGKDVEAEPHYREAVRRAGELRKSHPDDLRHAKLLATTLSDYSALLTNAGRLQEAASMLEQAVSAAQTFRSSLPKEPDPKNLNVEWLMLPMIQSNRAGVLAKLGRGRDAEAAIRPAIDSFRVLLATYPKTPDFKYLLANALKELADAQAADPAKLPEALRNLDEAVNLFTPLLKDFPNTVFYPRYLVSLRADRGSIRRGAGQLVGAREDLTYADGELVKRLRTEKEPADPLRQHGKVKASLARLTDQEGNREAARALVGEAIALQRKALEFDPARRTDIDLLDQHLALQKELAGPGR